MLRFLLSLALLLPLAVPAPVLAQTQVNPNQITRGNAYTTLSAPLAVSYCGAKPGCEWHINGAATVAATITIPANITLFFEGGGQLLPASGVTVTISGGKVVAPAGVQIFGGAGSVAGIHRVDPAWYPPSYTLAQIINLMPDTPDATILPWYAPIRSGTEVNGITRTNLTILGSGGQLRNADNSAFYPGTSVVQGQFLVNIPNFHVVGVGFDSGNYQAAHGGQCGGAVYNFNALGNLVDISLPGGAISNITVDDIWTLGCSRDTGGHSVLIEGFDGVRASNLHSYWNTRGVVMKSDHVMLTNVDAREHLGECLIFKADSTNGGVDLGLLSAKTATCTNTGFVTVFGDEANIASAKLEDLTMIGGGYLDINGYTHTRTGSVGTLDIINFRTSGNAGNSIQTTGNVGTVHIIGGEVGGGGSANGPALFANTGYITLDNFNVSHLNGPAAYAIYNNGANIYGTGGVGVALALPFYHGVAGVTRYNGTFSDYGPLADGNALPFPAVPYDAWGAGNLTVPSYGTNYFIKFSPSNSFNDHAVSVSGAVTAQIVFHSDLAATNLKRSFFYADTAGIFHGGFADDSQNDPVGLDWLRVSRSGYTPTSVSFLAPVTAPSVAPANGFSGSAAVGGCTLTITSGIITGKSGSC